MLNKACELTGALGKVLKDESASLQFRPSSCRNILMPTLKLLEIVK